MTPSKSWSSREESLLLLNAYLDNELDAASALDVERRIDIDPALKVEYQRLRDLRATLASHVRNDRTSPSFRQRIAAIAEPPRRVAPPTPRRLSRSYGWQQMAAAAMVTAVVASGSTYLSLRQTPGANEIAAIIAGHQRALLAAAPFDVASSDRHTVKPWFDGKLALSPKIVDLTGAGFPLVGGRVDIVDGAPVPTLVYRRREHMISLTAVPTPAPGGPDATVSTATRNGYAARIWQGPDFRYAAVSDVAPEELDDFVKLWRSDTPAKE